MIHQIYRILPVVGSSGSWLAQVVIARLFVTLLKPSQPHPEPWDSNSQCINIVKSQINQEPWIETVEAAKLFFKFSKDPKSLLIACNSSPSGSPP